MIFAIIFKKQYVHVVLQFCLFILDLFGHLDDFYYEHAQNSNIPVTFSTCMQSRQSINQPTWSTTANFPFPLKKDQAFSKIDGLFQQLNSSSEENTVLTTWSFMCIRYRDILYLVRTRGRRTFIFYVMLAR